MKVSTWDVEIHFFKQRKQEPPLNVIFHQVTTTSAINALGLIVNRLSPMDKKSIASCQVKLHDDRPNTVTPAKPEKSVRESFLDSGD